MYHPKSDMLQLIKLEALLKQIYQDTSLHYANDVDCGACYIVIYECVKALVAVCTSLSQFLIPKVFIVMDTGSLSVSKVAHRTFEAVPPFPYSYIWRNTAHSSI